MIRRKNRSLLALRHWREAIVLTQRINYVLSANSALYDGTICILFPLMAKMRQFSASAMIQRMRIFKLWKKEAA